MRCTRRGIAVTAAAAAALAAPALVRSDATGAVGAAPRQAACGLPCRAAYRAIARALPHDSTNAVARAIVRTPGFDYAELSRALGVPTAAEIVSRWRAASGRTKGSTR